MKDLYDDAAPSGAGETGEAAEPTDEGVEGNTTLIPKSILANKDCQPGEKLTFEVVHVYEDEIEVKPTGYKEDETPESPMATAEAGLDNVAE